MEDARTSFEKVIDLDPANASAYAALGLVYHITGDIDEAITQYHEVRAS